MKEFLKNMALVTVVILCILVIFGLLIIPVHLASTTGNLWWLSLLIIYVIVGGAAYITWTPNPFIPPWL